MNRLLKPCLVLTLICAAAAGGRGQTSPTVFINEIHYDNTGTDAGEFIEIAGPAGTNLARLFDRPLQRCTAASLRTTPTYSRARSPINRTASARSASRIRPTASRTARRMAWRLVFQGTTVIQFLSYEGTFTATTGPASGLTSTDIGVTETRNRAGRSVAAAHGDGNHLRRFHLERACRPVAGRGERRPVLHRHFGSNDRYRRRQRDRGQQRNGRRHLHRHRVGLAFGRHVRHRDRRRDRDRSRDGRRRRLRGPLRERAADSVGQRHLLLHSHGQRRSDIRTDRAVLGDAQQRQRRNRHRQPGSREPSRTTMRRRRWCPPSSSVRCTAAGATRARHSHTTSSSSSTAARPA